SDLVQTQGMKPQGVLRVDITPATIRQILEDFHCHVVPGLVPPCYQITCGSLRLLGAQISGLQERPERAPPGHPILLDELCARTENATEILRPRTILYSVKNDASHFLRPQFLRLRGESEERIGAASNKSLNSLGGARGDDPANVAWVHANIGD